MKNVIFGLLILFSSIVLSSCRLEDRQILQMVQTQLCKDSLDNIQICVANGVVILSGYIDDEASKKSIENRVKSIKYVKDVVNNLIVLPPNASEQNIQY